MLRHSNPLMIRHHTEDCYVLVSSQTRPGLCLPLSVVWMIWVILSHSMLLAGCPAHANSYLAAPHNMEVILTFAQAVPSRRVGDLASPRYLARAYSSYP
jgi:hypothetical protein